MILLVWNNKFTETESRIVVSRIWGGEGWEVITEQIHRVSVWDDEKVLVRENHDGCTIMWMCLVLLNCTLKNDSNVLYILRKNAAYIQTRWERTFKGLQFLSLGFGIIGCFLLYTFSYFPHNSLWNEKKVFKLLYPPIGIMVEVIKYFIKHQFLFSFIFFGHSQGRACRGSWARDQTQATAATWATAVNARSLSRRATRELTPSTNLKSVNNDFLQSK